MWRVLRVVASVVGVVLTLIGLGGLGDDLAGWERFVAAQGDIVRTLIVLAGVALIVVTLAGPQLMSKLRPPSASGTVAATKTDRVQPLARKPFDDFLALEYQRELDRRRVQEKARPYDPGLLVGPTLDAYRRRRYADVGQVPAVDPEEGRKAMMLLADAARDLANRIENGDTSVNVNIVGMGDLPELRRAAEYVVDAYAPHLRSAFQRPHDLPGPGTMEGSYVQDLSEMARRLEVYAGNL
jgi:hypothetical protein